MSHSQYFASTYQTILPALAVPGTSVSLPVVAVREGRAYDAVFLFLHSGSGAGNPMAWALLDPETGTIAQYARCELLAPPGAQTFPFVDAEGFDGPQEHRDALDILDELYSQLHAFLFSPSVVGEQAEQLARYRELFLDYVPPGHVAVYCALAPEFATWVGLSEPVAQNLDNGELPEPGTELLVLETLQQLRELFLNKIATDEHKQKLFDEVHSELQQHKNGLLEALTRPMEEDIIKLIDDIGKTMDLYRGRGFTQDNYRRLFSMFEGVQTDLYDLLYRHGVEPYSQEGDEVVVGRQKVLSTVATDDPAQDKRIAQRLAAGWEKNGKVIRPERVSVYLHTPDAGV